MPINGIKDNESAESPTHDSKVEEHMSENIDNPSAEARTLSMYRKTYGDKVKIIRKQDLGYPHRMKRMIFRPLIFLSFPVIAYAGFSYGSNLVWFNVLNGTASLVLSGTPYRFAPSIIGVAYIAPLIGTLLGYAIVTSIFDGSLCADST